MPKNKSMPIDCGLHHSSEKELQWKCIKTCINIHQDFLPVPIFPSVGVQGINSFPQCGIASEISNDNYVGFSTSFRGKNLNFVFQPIISKTINAIFTKERLIESFRIVFKA